MPQDSIDIALVVEDALSLAVMQRMLSFTGRGYFVKMPLITRGAGAIKKSIAKYCQASHVLPHVVLTDLDQVDCPSALRAQWGILQLPRTMLFRVAVREVESWILADRVGFATFAGVPVSKVTQDPESLRDPKQELVNLVRRSRKKRLAIELVPAVGSSVSIGPLYNERLGAFARNEWDIGAAMLNAPSLKRTVTRLESFMK